jgi:SAM-dependent methyltransferase
MDKVIERLRRAPLRLKKPFLQTVGVCPVCEQRVRFISQGSWLRDEFECENCKSAPRERALIATLNMYFPDWRAMKIHESSPALRASAKIARECKDYTPTHFVADAPLGQTAPKLGVRNENLEHQTFEDGVFDLVITQDVFEHLFRPDLAIREIARTLRPGGAHVCTVPIGRKSQSSIKRAALLDDGRIEHLLEPIYHGNPIDTEGSLVTFDYGYDIADAFDKFAPVNTTIVMIDDLSRGIRAEFIEVLVSRAAGGETLADLLET